MTRAPCPPSWETRPEGILIGTGSFDPSELCYFSLRPGEGELRSRDGELPYHRASQSGKPAKGHSDVGVIDNLIVTAHLAAWGFIINCL